MSACVFNLRLSPLSSHFSALGSRLSESSETERFHKTLQLKQQAAQGKSGTSGQGLGRVEMGGRVEQVLLEFRRGLVKYKVCNEAIHTSHHTMYETMHNFGGLILYGRETKFDQAW